jgi:L-methionine (R)-S-oxide reductase
MSESIQLESGLSKEEKYLALFPQLEALLGSETDLVANMANLCAGLKEAFGWHWVGFYVAKEGELVLGPFQGPVACTRIPFHKGVCGAAFTKMETVIVPDVDAFPGHIACSSFSRSEIVVPMVVNGVCQLVLDVDSSELDDFDFADQQGLEKITRLLARHF